MANEEDLAVRLWLISWERMTIGIYKIQNKINSKIYIGLSIDIENRIKVHFLRYENENSSEYNKTLYRAIRKYGKENFDIVILEECKQKELYDKEKYYILKYNSYKNGYNETPGGEGVVINAGEKHPNHKLNELQVVDIRTRYNNREKKEDVYKLYSHIINKTGFNKVWQGKTWKNLMMEVYTSENIKIHMNEKSSLGQENSRAKLSDKNVYDIRLRRNNGEDRKKVYEDYKNFITFRSFEQIWYYQNWKHIVI